jgi:hypothetical protein
MADNNDDLRTTIRVLDGVEESLRTVQNFVLDKLQDLALKERFGRAFDIPNKVAGFGPLVLRQLGYGPGDPVYDLATDIAELVDTVSIASLLGLPEPQLGGASGPTASDTGPDAPPAEQVLTGVFDP